MNMHVGRTAILVGLATLLSLAGCSGATTPAANQPGERANPIAAPQPVVVAGPVTIVSTAPFEGYYSSTIAFRVKNPNATLAAVSVPYRVTVTSQGKVIYTSTGKDTVTVAPLATQLVVNELHDSNGVGFASFPTKPDSAAVQLYSNPSLLLPAATAKLPSDREWHVTNVQYVFGQDARGKVTGDLTWTGSETQQNANLEVVIHAGTDISGPIIAAGGGAGRFDWSTSLFTLAPGQTVPWTATLDGFPQPGGEGSSAVLPQGPLTIEVAMTIDG